MTATSTRAAIDEFLGQQRLAVVGVSRDAKDFTRALFRTLREHGYDVVAVNPLAREIEGQPCYARVQDIAPAVDGALIMTPPQVSAQVVRDCAAAGVTRVWLHRGEGIGAVSDEALAACQQAGISVVPGFCPYMFLSQAGFIHRAHGVIMKLGGSYPR